MAVAHRFLFDKDFNSELEDSAGAPVQPAGAAAQPSEEPASSGYSEEEIAEAREQAYQAGYAAGVDAGRQDTRATAERATAAAMEKVAAGLGALAESAIAGEARRDGEALQISITLVKKLFPALARRDGMAEVEALIGECLARVRDEPRVVVRASEGDIEALRAHIDPLAERSGFEGKIVLLGDDALSDGDVRVEWADGGCERDSARLWAEVEALTARVLDAPDTDTSPKADAGAEAKAETASPMRRTERER